MAWLRRLIVDKHAAPPPLPPDPYADAPAAMYPAGRDDGRNLTLFEHRLVRASIRARRDAIEREVAQGDADDRV